MQVFNSAPARSFIHCVDAGEVLRRGSATPVSREKMHGLMDIPAPVIWIGGSEPLAHPGIGHFVRAIAKSGHFVFLETNGILLRRRIHEFQPLPQLFLTVRLDSLQAPESTLAVEGLRAAHLSGFFTLVHSLVHEDSEFAQLSALRTFILENGVDGWVITAASADQMVARKACQAHRLIPDWFWRRFSEQIEEGLLAQKQGRELIRVSDSVGERPHPEGHEESARVA